MANLYQGRVEVIHTGKTRWQHVNLDETLCAGDSVRIEAHSRAAIRLKNQTVLRLDAGTAITFSKIEADKPSWLELLKGAVHFITRVPRTLKIKTPFVNAAVEGTEFVISVDSNATAVWVFEGLVSLRNPPGVWRSPTVRAPSRKPAKPPYEGLLSNPKRPCNGHYIILPL